MILCAIFALLTLLSNKFNLFKGIERADKKQFGTVYYALSLLCFSIVCVIEREVLGNDKNSFACFAIAFVALALGDGSASLFGSKFPSIKIHEGKTLVGTISCCACTLFGLLICKLFGIVPLAVPALIAIALITGVGELIGGKLDNLLVPLLCYLAALGCLFLSNLPVALLLFCAVFYLGFLCKFLTLFGAVGAGCIGGLFFYFGGILPLLFLVFCYLVMLTCTLVQKIKKQDISSVVAKTKGKDFTEIFVNGFFPCLALILFGIFKTQTFLLISLICVSANFVDSLSSDIGVLSKTPPFDLFKRKRVQAGESGGVTLLGTVASAIGALVFGTLSVFISTLPPSFLFFVCPLCFFGTLVDSLLGSTLQAKFQCTVCKKITERKEHCQAPTAFVSGLKRLNNDGVNFLSSACVFALSLLLLLL